MKKIIWLIFLSLLSVPVLAKETYYSKYTPYSEFTDKEVVETDTVSVKEENRYKWYKEEVTAGDYKLYNKTDSFSNDCYLKELSKWSNEKTDNPGYVYQTRELYKYLYSHGARYIHLYNLNGSYDSFRLTEFNIKYKNKDIDYTFECNGCWGEFDKHIHNGIYNENQSYIKNGGSIIFDLGKEYPAYYLDILFYIFDLGDANKTFTVGYSNDKKNIYLYKNFNLKFKDELWKNAYKVDILGTDDTFTGRKVYNVYSANNLQGEHIIKKDVNKEYAYQEKWCKLNKINKVYTDYTNKDVEGYKRDLKTKKIFYSYKTRDKLELEIKDITKKIDLNDFIVSKTGNVLIEDNIDWTKNGTYKIKFILNDLVVNKEVNLNLEENNIKLLEEEIKNLNNKITELNKLLIEKENIIKSNLDKIKELNNLIKIKDKLIENNNKENDNELNDLINNNLKEINKLKDEYNKKIMDLNNLNDKKHLDLTNKNNVLKNNNDLLNKKLNNLENINKEIIKNNNDTIYINNLYKKKINELENNLLNLNNGISSKLKEKDDIINKCSKELKENKIKEESMDKNKFLLKIGNLKYVGLLFGLIFLLILIYFIFKKKN